MKFQPVIKWTGSKRWQSEKIISYFPKEIDTYYEPFVGGASVLFQLLHNDIKVNKYICSDINKDLIDLWNTIKNNPSDLIESYFTMWHELNADDNIERKKQYFYSVRERFNRERKSSDFLFLSRTCVNGLIRYNSKGEFNTSFHFSRKGIKPEKLKEIVLYWSEKLNENNIKFICCDYKEIITTENDFMYLDPPYANTKGVYYGEINYDEFWNWIRKQKAKYLLSFNGKRGSIDNTYNVPKDLYQKHIYLHSGRSSFKDLTQQVVQYVQESLYINV
ncbi:DNA methyltransferase [Geobacillus virus E3]|uniref:DNA methyltransferase n=1 Tax=Geobacillus virus E3 TaxID=1572712 RepID=UPI000671CC2D|nr:DNA methyltransferase [Geobacillus virus E3]AJA41426.1 putative DNA adenine methylase [Geobacillus virus E3]